MTNVFTGSPVNFSFSCEMTLTSGTPDEARRHSIVSCFRLHSWRSKERKHETPGTTRRMHGKTTTHFMHVSPSICRVLVFTRDESSKTRKHHKNWLSRDFVFLTFRLFGTLQEGLWLWCHRRKREDTTKVHFGVFSCFDFFVFSPCHTKTRTIPFFRVARQKVENTKIRLSQPLSCLCVFAFRPAELKRKDSTNRRQKPGH